MPKPIGDSDESFDSTKSDADLTSPCEDGLWIMSACLELGAVKTAVSVTESVTTLLGTGFPFTVTLYGVLRLQKTESPEAALVIAEAMVLYDKAAEETMHTGWTVAETLNEATVVAPMAGNEASDKTAMLRIPTYEANLTFPPGR